MLTADVSLCCCCYLCCRSAGGLWAITPTSTTTASFCFVCPTNGAPLSLPIGPPVLSPSTGRLVFPLQQGGGGAAKACDSGSNDCGGLYIVDASSCSNTCNAVTPYFSNSLMQGSNINYSPGRAAGGLITIKGSSLLYGLTLQANSWNYNSGQSVGGVYSVNADGSGAVVVASMVSGVGGCLPSGSLSQATDSLLLWGVTTQSASCSQGGAVFSVDVLHGGSFVWPSSGVFSCSSGTAAVIAAGCTPIASPLYVAVSGLLYGSNSEGGDSTSLSGTLWSLDTQNGSGHTLTVVHTFGQQATDGSGTVYDGRQPLAALMLASNQLLYGSTAGGGIVHGADFGTLFTLSLSGTFTTIYAFRGQSPLWDGARPIAALTQGTGAYAAVVYGVTVSGGKNNAGIVFSFLIATAP